MTKSEKSTNERQARQLEFISQYCTDIRYIPGAENHTADALSRIEAITTTIPVSQTELADAQKLDTELQDYLQKKKATSMTLDNRTDAFGTTLTCDTTKQRPRPFVPEQLRRRIIQQLHDNAHPGVAATTRLVATNFIWPRIAQDCKQFVQQCMPCQQSKIGRHTNATLYKPIPPNGRFRELNVDIIGPYPESKGNRFCLTIIDRFSRWPAAIPMPDSTASSVSKALIEGWIQHCGVPQKITTDRGRQFESTLFRELNLALGTTHLHTTAYHPQANGIIERWHRTLKAAIKCLTETDWAPAVPLVVLALRNTLKEDLQTTPAELVYGESLQLPGAFFDDPPQTPTSDFVRAMQKHFADIKAPDTSHHVRPKMFLPKELKTCEWILLRTDAVRRPFQRPYEGPYKVVSRSDRAMTIKKHGKDEKVSIDRVKPAFIFHDEQPNVNNELNAPTNSDSNEFPASNEVNDTTTNTTTFVTAIIPVRLVPEQPATHSRNVELLREPPPSRIPVRRTQLAPTQRTRPTTSSTYTTRSGRPSRTPSFHYH